MITGVETTDSGAPGATLRSDVIALERLTQALVGITIQSLGALDETVTVAQFRLLRMLDGFDGAADVALAEALDAPASSVTRLVDKLETAGLVSRGADPRRPGTAALEVTDSGRAVIAAVLARRRLLLETVLNTMAPDQRQHVSDAASRFVLLAGDAVDIGARGPLAL